MKYSLGLDSTDSQEGGCTTWTLSKIIDILYELDSSVKITDYPMLIRLNPNIKLKTRGNAALSLKFQSTLGLEFLFQEILQIVKADVTKFPDQFDKMPGVILHQGEELNDDIYFKALNSLVDLKVILHNLSEMSDTLFWPKESLGLIGAFAAMNANLDNDYTFELLAYRSEENWGSKRIINNENLRQLSKLFPNVFSGYDWEQDRELIAPSGPDPVYYGIRGENVDDLIEFNSKLERAEKVDSYTIFKTNQATDGHVFDTRRMIKDQYAFANLVHVVLPPSIQAGGHVKLRIRYNYQEYDLMVFEPSKNLAKKANLLLIGDQIFIHANVRENDFGLHFALEYMEIIYLSANIVYTAPKCTCGSKTTSAGKFKGYKCVQCGTSIFRPLIQVQNRDLYLGQKCYASLSAQRHLTKPLSRLNRKNSWSINPTQAIRKIIL